MEGREWGSKRAAIFVRGSWDPVDVSSGDITSRPGSVSSHYLVLCEFHKRFILFCKFCVKDLFVLLPDLVLVVFEQALAQVADLLQRKRGLVLP